jgi:hypothetical protein
MPNQDAGSDRAVDQAIQSYLNEQEEQRKRWFREQATDSGTWQWKQQLVATLAERWEQQYGEMLRPGDGTEFYPPSKEAHQRQVEDITKTVLGYLQERPEPPEPGTTVGTYAAEALAYEAMRHLSQLAARPPRRVGSARSVCSSNASHGPNSGFVAEELDRATAEGGETPAELAGFGRSGKSPGNQAGTKRA